MTDTDKNEKNCWLREDLPSISDDHKVWKRIGFYLA